MQHTVEHSSMFQTTYVQILDIRADFDSHWDISHLSMKAGAEKTRAHMKKSTNTSRSFKC